MNLQKSLVWMFIGSILIGVYLNAMNVLAFQFSDLYFSAPTLIYGALLMASNMCILETLMYYSMNGTFSIWFVFFVLFSLLCIYFLRKQVGVDDDGYLKRMISHHSTAITTSKKIIEKTKNPNVYKLAKEIIDIQEKEIALMKSYL